MWLKAKCSEMLSFRLLLKTISSSVPQDKQKLSLFYPPSANVLVKLRPVYRDIFCDDCSRWWSESFWRWGITFPSSATVATTAN